MDEVSSFGTFLLTLDCDFPAIDFDELALDVVDVIVVVVIDKELLMRFCCKPIKGLALLELP